MHALIIVHQNGLKQWNMTKNPCKYNMQTAQQIYMGIHLSIKGKGSEQMNLTDYLKKLYPAINRSYIGFYCRFVLHSTFNKNMDNCAYLTLKNRIVFFLSSPKSSYFLPEFSTHLPVTWWKSCLSISPSRELAPILNKFGCVQSSPSSSFIKESHVKASLALRIPPAGLKPTLWPVCWNEKQNHDLFSQ